MRRLGFSNLVRCELTEVHVLRSGSSTTASAFSRSARGYRYRRSLDLR